MSATLREQMERARVGLHGTLEERLGVLSMLYEEALAPEVLSYLQESLWRDLRERLVELASPLVMGPVEVSLRLVPGGAVEVWGLARINGVRCFLCDWKVGGGASIYPGSVRDITDGLADPVVMVRLLRRLDFVMRGEFSKALRVEARKKRRLSTQKNYASMALLVDSREGALREGEARFVSGRALLYLKGCVD